ncbi:hypothetical protein DRH14_00775 [Candidatus Shapirobacteria bacterium]|nr:MAG: hypothetical protein DRH14_00775 [Candidatus Shapirobacteria bacterium]
MKKNKVVFSIIIPVRQTNPYLKENLQQLKKQSFKDFEVLVIDDQISATPNPAQKRNIGAKMAKGKYLAFLDDDSYPAKDWLKNAFKLFQQQKNISAVCGRALTPPQDSLLQQTSGLFHSSFLGSGGAGQYRNKIKSARYIDDYPSVNLIVEKSDFKKIKGFDTYYWPGEDTILCLNLTKKLGKKILYHPSLIVHHHRRAIFKPHLAQIKRYAIHRSFFAKKFPQTSLKIGYFTPTIFLLYLLSLPFLSKLSQLYFFPLYTYIILLTITFVSFLIKHSLLLSILATITIPVTHLYYGFYFIIGLLKKNVYFQPRQDKL